MTVNTHGPRRERMEDNVAFHMTTLDQAVMIALLGLWSRNRLAEISLAEFRLADAEIVSRREQRLIFGRSIW